MSRYEILISSFTVEDARTGTKIDLGEGSREAREKETIRLAQVQG